MAPGEPVIPGPPDRAVGASRPRFARVLNVFLAALLLAALLRLVIPSFYGWYHDDDFQDMRWVLEYRTAPWQALTGRHALHDHIRPLTLIAFWVGSCIANGAFWGQHLVEALLLGGAVLGVGALGRDISGRTLPGGVSALLAISLLGFERTMGWTAWTCSAGELCCGMWALVAARRALRRVHWLPLAAILLVFAGLFKEPGSLVYPVGALSIALGAWRRGQRDRRVIGVGALLAVGAATFAFTWHPANFSRVTVDGVALREQVLLFLRSQVAFMLDLWPGRATTGTRIGVGIPLLLFVLAVTNDLLKNVPVGSLVSRLWPLGVAVVAVAGYVWPGIAVAAFVPAIAVALLMHGRDDRGLGLVLYLANVFVLLPFPVFNGMEVSLLGGGFGLALYVGIWVCDGLSPGCPGRSRVAAWIGIGWQALLLVLRLFQPTNTNDLERQRDHELRALGLGALTQSLHVSEARLAGLDVSIASILPTLDLNVGSSVGAGLHEVEIPREVVFDVDPNQLDMVVVSSNLLTSIAPKGGPGAGEGWSLALQPGYYVLGVAAFGVVPTQAEVHAQDSCGHVWTVKQSLSRTAILTATPLIVESGCEHLDVHADDTGAAGRAILAKLPAPRTSLWFDLPLSHRLSVDSTDVPAGIGGPQEQAGQGRAGRRGGGEGQVR